MTATRQIIAFGDGGLNENDPYMDLYVLAQSKAVRPKICVIPTASGDNMGLVKFFMHIFGKYPCKPSFLTLFHPHTADIRGFLLEQNIVYVTGGQSKSMLGVWKEWGLDIILREAYVNGTILSGGSAGSVCWFDQCITDSLPGSLTVMDCLGMLPYSHSPHYTNPSRRIAYTKYVKEGKIKPGYAADDFATLHFVNEKIHRNVSSKPYAKAWKVYLNNDNVVQKRLKTRWLGIEEYQNEFIWSGAPFADIIEETEEIE